ncbi:CpsD/CapB family tyrosine-protein kinase [Paenibacillus sp. MMS18-CY102]|uniref:CpsD/CapB family tyrosine-protein kinase n=1 Tax=Paenibacillus sp. MMS18-CY102 TaxID=2682849 RepID=UPI0013653B63|nr:CpsD/CapB family tyrosine-protein kinase [Paenibacillus sp. MMS18-CY102]MWC27324.1 polysaccharide biosynthesis tyrosine autokinase [Paenibacillus sp. MMS18-CY102]
MSRWRNKLLMLGGLESSYVDLYLSLRTQLDYAASGKDITVIAIVAPHRGSGVTETAANLAITYAQAGRRTLLVDGDLREPIVHKLFGISNRIGLSSLLSYTSEAAEAVQQEVLPNLSIVASGLQPVGAIDPVAAGAGELHALFGQWKGEYDVVLMDMPPMLSSAAAQLLAGVCDGALLVLRSGVVKEEDALRAKGMLETAGVAVLGTVLAHSRRKKVPKRYSLS